MGKLIYILSAMALFVSCSGDGDKAGQNVETEAEIEAAMMQGREAGRAIVNRKWADTLELQNHILEARSHRSRYEMQKRPQSAKAFDQGVVTTVYSVNPDLARQLFPDSLLQLKDN